MQRKIVRPGGKHLAYEIREIVKFAASLEERGVKTIWENIGDPVRKGEPLPDWMKTIISAAALEDMSYAYVSTEGDPAARSFLAERVNARGGCSVRPEDIIFFNGLGDAINKLFSAMHKNARVIVPSPGYSAFSSCEAAHACSPPLVYRLDPDRDWFPDFDELEQIIRGNGSVEGLLLINPGNPTGAVYPAEILKEYVRLAEKYGLFIICDETYANIVYGRSTEPFCRLVNDVPSIILRSVSKEFPWPGARCGWIEVYNRRHSRYFSDYVDALIALKRLEVCSTALPQRVIPRIMSDPRYCIHLEFRRRFFARRADEAAAVFSRLEGARIIKPAGSFYFPVVFDENRIKEGMSLPVANNRTAGFVRSSCREIPADKQFVYWLLASTGICVVPLSGFMSSLPGFRMTLLEYDDNYRKWIYSTVAGAVSDYLRSA